MNSEEKPDLPTDSTSDTPGAGAVGEGGLLGNSPPNPDDQSKSDESQAGGREGRRLVSDPFDPSSSSGCEGGPSDFPQDSLDDLVGDVGELPVKSRGWGRANKMVAWEVVRSLRVPDDLPLLTESLPAPRQNLTQIRHSHHQLAQLIGQGTSQTEASRLTGYNLQYITVLKSDPTFKELIDYYAAQKEMAFVDVVERMRSLGLSTLDELQNRLETDPTSYSNRELMEQAELTLIKPMAASRGQINPGQSGAPGSGGVSVNVKFVQSNQSGASSSPESGPHPIIDVTASREDEKKD